MKKLLFTVVAVVSLISASNLYAQGWPYPMSSPTDTPVSCGGCPAPRTNDPTDPQPIINPTWNYSDPLIAFTGRFIDSNWTRDWQQPFRTARAWETWIVPERNRVYMKVGSALEAYDINTFFTRLANRDALAHGSQRQDGIDDRFLKGDKYFYAEAGGSGWQTVVVDGQERLSQVDFDDRGYCYLAYSLFGWGIVKDDGGSNGGLMQSIYQNPIRDLAASYISVVKTSANKYYVLAGGSPFRIWDATNPAAPVKIGNFSTYYVQRAKTTKNFAGVSTNYKLDIYNVDTMFNGGSAQVLTAPGNGQYTTVTSDGTNLYACATQGGNGNLVLNVLTPDGAGGMIEHRTTLDSFSVTRASYNNGFLALFGVNPATGYDVRLFKVAGTNFEEVPLNAFFSKYYAAPPTGYVRGVRSTLYHAAPYFDGSKLYLIASAFGLGDVFEVRGGDTISASIQGTGVQNLNAPPRATGSIFYGDKVRFLATTSNTQKPVAWNFGNPEAAAGADPNIASGTTGIPQDHQYSGLTPATLGGARVVNANALGLSSNVSLTLKPPVGRIKIYGTQFVFTQPDADSPAPVVLGDTLVDASDGDLVGHYTEWTQDAVPSVKTPDVGMSAGDCGAHTLSFAAHYGPYSAAFATIGPDYPVAINPFNYTVRPFAVAVGAPATAGGNTTFTSTTRVSATAGIGALVYHWDLLDAAGNIVVIPTNIIITAADFTVPTSAIPNGGKARVTVTTAAALTGNCVPYTTATATSTPLVFADPVIQGDCTNGAPPCNFSVSSASNADMSNWTYAWSVSPTTNVITGPTNLSTLSPVFTQVGTYTLNLNATNILGARAAAPKPVVVTQAGSTCTPMGPTVFVSWSGPTSGCNTSPLTSCSPAEQLPFNIGSYPNYPWSCSPVWTFTWSFGDGGTATSSSYDEVVTHAYNAAGTYNVTCAISNGAGISYSSTGSVKVGTAYQPPPPPPPPGPGGCGTMNAANVFVNYTNALSTCTAFNHSGCVTNQPVTFDVGAYGYDFGCATHQVNWTFGDGTGAAGTPSQHSYLAPGTYTITATISRTGQQFNATQTIIVGGTSNNGSCPTMTPANVFASFHNATGGCTAMNQSGCLTNDGITFDIGGFQYDFECAVHTISWDFGDGQTATGMSAQHSFGAPGTYPVRATIARTGQTYVITLPVSIGDSNPQLPDVSLDFNAAGTGNPHEFRFTPVADPADVVKKYLWDFGDNTGESSFTYPETPIHAYADNKAEHEVTLKVYDIQNRELKTHTETVTEQGIRRRNVRH